jgi:hypothetical protein
VQVEVKYPGRTVRNRMRLMINSVFAELSKYTFHGSPYKYTLTRYYIKMETLNFNWQLISIVQM